VNQSTGTPTSITPELYREQVAEVLTSWFPEYEGVGTVIEDATAELLRVQR
jgi:hypothetical protein